MDPAAALGRFRVGSPLPFEQLRFTRSDSAVALAGTIAQRFATPCRITLPFLSSGRPYTTPIPVGAKILSPEKTKKSTPSEPMFTRRAQHRSGLRDQFDVRVVLQVRDDDLVTAVDVRLSPALGHQVDGLGRPSDEDDVVV